MPSSRSTRPTPSRSRALRRVRRIFSRGVRLGNCSSRWSSRSRSVEGFDRETARQGGVVMNESGGMSKCKLNRSFRRSEIGITLCKFATYSDLYRYTNPSVHSYYRFDYALSTCSISPSAVRFFSIPVPGALSNVPSLSRRLSSIPGTIPLSKRSTSASSPSNNLDTSSSGSAMPCLPFVSTTVKKR